MTFSIRMNDAEAGLVRDMASVLGKTVSELIRESVMERIEDELDRKAYDKAMAEYREDPETIPFEKVAAEFGLR